MGDTNAAVIERLREAAESNDLSQLAAVLDDAAAADFVQEWPQSGERIVGLEAYRKINQNYEGATGNSPKMAVRSIVGGGDVFVTEGTIDYGDGVPVSYVGIAQFRDGKVAKLTEYFANPFEAPAWRADMVERMEPAGV